MFRFPVVGIALLISMPALWPAFVTGTMPIETALVRFLIAMPVATVMVMIFDSLVRSYRRQATRAVAAAAAARVAEAGRLTSSTDA